MEEGKGKTRLKTNLMREIWPYLLFTFLFTVTVICLEHDLWQKERERVHGLFAQKQMWMARTVSERVANDMEDRIGQVSYMAELLTQNPEINEEYILRTFRQVSEIGEYFTRIHFIDRKGRINAAFSSLDNANVIRLRGTDIFVNNPTDIELAGPFLKAMRTGVTQVSDVGHLADGRVGLMILAPVYRGFADNVGDRMEKFQGVVVGVVDFGQINRELSQMLRGNGNSEEFLGIDRHGRIIFAADKHKLLTPFRPISENSEDESFSRFARRIMQEDEALGTYVLSQHGNREAKIGAFARVNFNGRFAWSIAVESPEREADLLYWQSKNHQMHLLFLFLIFAQVFLSSLLIIRQVGKNMQKEMELERERLLNLHISEIKKFNESILGNIPEGIVVTNRKGEIIYVNPVFIRLTGTAAEEITGRHFSSLHYFDHFDNAEAERRFRRIVEFGEDFKAISLNFKTSAGNVCPIEVLSTPLRGEGGKILGCCSIIRSLEQELLLQQKARQLELFSAVGELATGVAHKIRNPLTTVKGYVQLLNRKAQSGEAEKDCRRYLEYISAEIETVDGIISDFLQIAYPVFPGESQKSLHDLLDEIVLLLDTRTLLQHIEIEKEYASFLPPINIEVAELRQVFLCIIQNSFQAMPAGGRLVLRTEYIEDHNAVRVTIKDTGKGIDPAYLPRVTEPYFTGEGRLGLGLAIAKEIIDSAGGKIEIASQLGAGTTVIVSIPVGGEKFVA